MMKLPEATYFDPRIDYRIANPNDVPSGNTIAAQPSVAQPSAPLSRICNSARNIRQFAIAAQQRNVDNRKTMVIGDSSERATSIAQGNAGNALCCSKRTRIKPQRDVIRYISFDYALSGRNQFYPQCDNLNFTGQQWFCIISKKKN
jgi:hypothetical protein